MPLFRKKASNNADSPKKTAKKPEAIGESRLIHDVSTKIQEAEKLILKGESPLNYGRTSRLSKTMQEILNDKGALGYFIQFMDSRQALSLIKFWLDSESFRTAALTSSHNSDNEEDTRGLEGRGKESSPAKLNHNCDSTSKRANSKAEKKLQRNICDDAVRIYQKYIAREAHYPVPVTEETRSAIVTKICTQPSAVGADCFKDAQKNVRAILEKDYLWEFLNSEFHSKHQIDLLTSDQVFVTDLLYNDTSLSYFMEYLEQEGARSLLEMCLSLDNFQQQLVDASTSMEDAQADAVVLYDRWFSLQAKCPLGFTDAVRGDVEENICREGGTLPTCFQLPHKIVFLALERYYLGGFMESPLFMQYLMELMRSIQTRSPPAPHRQRSDSLSTSSSVSEISKASDVIRRPRGLSFGHVTHLGRFETDMEPMPCGSEENSKFSKAMKKLLHKEGNKEEEDAAWKIAERIIRDVTSVTMAEPVSIPDTVE